MHWTKLRLTGASVIGFVDLPIEGATPFDLFVLQDVDGLGAPEIDVSISNELFQARLPRARQIVAKVGLNPDWAGGQTPSDLRGYIYGMLTGGYVGSQISAIVMDGDDELFRAEGYVSKIEPEIFTKDPMVQITIECLSAYFHAFDDVDVVVESPSVVNDITPGWTNVGSAPAGFSMQCILTDAVDYFQINTEGNAQRLRFNWFDKLGVHGSAGSLLLFNTVERSRSAVLRHKDSPGVYTDYDLMSALSLDSTWLQLHSDLNQFTTNLTHVTWNAIGYLPLFWGV